jgi:hypothetical protein
VLGSPQSRSAWSPYKRVGVFEPPLLRDRLQSTPFVVVELEW